MKHNTPVSKMKKTIFIINLVLFALVWLAVTLYTLLAIFNSAVPYTVISFWVFIIFLDILAIPLIWLWWKQGSKTITHKTWVLMVSVILIFYWGFATIHSFLTLNLNDLQLRWTAFAYIWEVVIVGAYAAYVVVRVSRFADHFLRDSLHPDKTELAPADIHSRIAAIPIRAALFYVFIVIFGYTVGSVQLYFFARQPIAEIIKNLITGLTAGALSSFFVFFYLERIVESALEKSGKMLRSLPIDKTKKRSSLFVKIYAVSGLLALVSVGFFGPLAYARGQAILEEALRNQLSGELEREALNFQLTGNLLKGEELHDRFGPRGSLTLFRQAEITEGVYIDREYSPKIIGYYSLPNGEVLKGIIFLSDFSKGLTALLLYSFIIFFMIFGALTIISTLFARSVTYPIRKIKEGAIRIGEGNFNEKIDVFTNDELEDVGLSLSEAARKIELSYAQLENEIDKRTMELARVNELQQAQIKELDKTAKLLVRRDFELLQANELLREMDEAKSRFVSIAAHQLRTPLSGVKWSLQMLLAQDFGTVSREQIEILSRSLMTLERLTNLAGDLLNVARIEGGQFLYKLMPFHVEDVLKKVYEEYKTLAQERGITFTLTLPDKFLPFLTGDSESMVMVMQILVENAVAYTQSNGVVEIKARLDEKLPDKVLISVSDTGMGIASAQKSLIGQKFFRGDNVIRQQIPGTGLGIYIVKKIFEKQNLRLEIESEEGKGSTFSFTFPVASGKL